MPWRWLKNWKDGKFHVQNISSEYFIFGWLHGFYGISTPGGYLTSNPIYTNMHIKFIWFINEVFRLHCQQTWAHVCIYKKDSALNYLQGLICHKPQPVNQLMISSMFSHGIWLDSSICHVNRTLTGTTTLG